MDLRSRLAAIVEPLPPGSAVTLPVDQLREWIASDRQPSAPLADGPQVDFTVGEVAAALHRGESTVRGWLAEGVFPKAYRFRNREWRIPRSDLRAMQRTEAVRHNAGRAEAAPRRRSEDMSGWRKHLLEGTR